MFRIFRCQSTRDTAAGGGGRIDRNQNSSSSTNPARWAAACPSRHPAGGRLLSIRIRSSSKSSSLTEIKSTGASRENERTAHEISYAGG
jgi:hypothetical protein